MKVSITVEHHVREYIQEVLDLMEVSITVEHCVIEYIQQVLDLVKVSINVKDDVREYIQQVANGQMLITQDMLRTSVAAHVEPPNKMCS